MAKKKKRTSKKKSKRAPRTPAYLSKLDPTLHLGALRARREKGAEAPRRPESIRELDVGIHSLASQMTPLGFAQFCEDGLVPVVVDCRGPEEVLDKMRSWGGECSSVASSTVVGRVPRTRLSSLARLTDVRYVEPSTKLSLHCDQAHLSSRLKRGATRTVSERGGGVLVGIVDTGIDVDHPAFRDGGETRIVRYLDQFTGRRFDASEIDAGDASDSRDTVGHGTHVAGIAAGNGAGSPGRRLAGVAPQADLAIVKSTLASADILSAMAEIFDLARERNQPCVVNGSFGGHVGGHDGTTIIERTIDELSGPGRIVVLSAGNEGVDAIHARTVLRGDGTVPASWSAGFRLNPRTLDTASGPMDVGLLVLQVWQQREDELAVRLRAPSGQLIEAPAEGSEEVDVGSFLVNASRQEHPYSGDPFVSFQVITVSEPQWLNGWSVIAEERAAGSAEVGAVHAWIRDGAEGAFTTGASFDTLVGMPGTAYAAVTVASYTTRNAWRSRDPENPTVRLSGLEIEAASAFSSPGPTRDGQNKPEIAAPGEWLLAPLSKDAPVQALPLFTRVDGMDYVSLRGTSMSAPYVTGAVALLLQKEPTLDWAEAKRRLIKSARQDRKTDVAWNAKWGYGKLDVERLLTIEP